MIMPDMTMCSGKGCPVASKCYRFTATPSSYQSYFSSPPYDGKYCDMYWGDNEESIFQQLKDITDGKSNS
jgi:hypothetical protein